MRGYLSCAAILVRCESVDAGFLKSIDVGMLAAPCWCPAATVHCVSSGSDQFLRRSFRAEGQPAYAPFGRRSGCPWVTAGDRSFPPVLARIWHGRSDRHVLVRLLPLPQVTVSALRDVVCSLNLEASMATPMASPTGGDYDAYAREYAPNVAWRERGSAEDDPFGILPSMLDLLGDVSDQRVLDAGCGEGYLARVLAACGARVTGVDISPRLIEQAREKSPDGAIDYRVADLSLPLPEPTGSFDVVGSYLVLNDVPDYRGFARTIASVLSAGGRAVLAFNNPYYGVLSRHVTDYFDSGRVSPYRGLWSAGIKVYYYHRTLEEYLDAFLSSGLRLAKLADLTGLADDHPPHAIVPEGDRFPRFMMLGFVKP